MRRSCLRFNGDKPLLADPQDPPMPGSIRLIALTLAALLLACAAGQAVASDQAKRPLQLKLGTAPQVAMPVRSIQGAPRPVRFKVAEPGLSQRAIESLLADADSQAADSASGPADASFRFNRRGHVGRDLAQGYNTMCEAVSRKVWDDPNGKRVKFDVAGKPGLGVEIPLR